MLNFKYKITSQDKKANMHYIFAAETIQDAEMKVDDFIKHSKEFSNGKAKLISVVEHNIK